MPSLDSVDFAYTRGPYARGTASQGRPVLAGFSLDLPDTGTVCLLGPSGCGKTTLLRLLAGLETPGSGTITGLTGRRVSMVFQENRLLPWETARRNATTVAGKGAGEAEGWLRALGLGEDLDRHPGELSGGMARRVAIARALAAPHDVLLLDEPFAGLDEASWRAAAGRIAEATANRLTVLVTHVPDHAAAMAATVVRLAGPPLRVT